MFSIIVGFVADSEQFQCSFGAVPVHLEEPMFSEFGAQIKQMKAALI